jgi:hypothetical protein
MPFRVVGIQRQRLAEFGRGRGPTTAVVQLKRPGPGGV